MTDDRVVLPNAGRERENQRTLRRFVVASSVAIVVAGVVAWREPLWASWVGQFDVRGFVHSFGGWGPLVIILLHVSQVFLVPIPGQAVDMASGYLFGVGWGTLYCMIGVAISSLLAFALARRCGRPLVERLVGVPTLARLDGYARRRGALFFFLVFLFPLAPDDVACLVAGLTPLAPAHLFLLAVVGRLPGILVANWVGARASALSPNQWAGVLALLLVMAVVFWRYRARLEAATLGAIGWVAGRGGTDVE